MSEERIIKLIWDFRGPDALKTAEHHAVHLDQYIDKHNVGVVSGFEEINQYYAIAYLAIEESKMVSVRDTLRPHRGELYEG